MNAPVSFGIQGCMSLTPQEQLTAELVSVLKSLSCQLTGAVMSPVTSCLEVTVSGAQGEVGDRIEQIQWFRIDSLTPELYATSYFNLNLQRFVTGVSTENTSQCSDGGGGVQQVEITGQPIHTIVENFPPIQDVNVLNDPFDVHVLNTQFDVNVVNNQFDVNVTNASITVDGVVDIGNFPAVQQVEIIDQPISVDVGNFPTAFDVNVTNASLTVDGTVDIGNFPAIQQVEITGTPGSVDVTNFPAVQDVHIASSIPLGLADQDFIADVLDSLNETYNGSVTGKNSIVFDVLDFGTAPDLVITPRILNLAEWDNVLVYDYYTGEAFETITKAGKYILPISSTTVFSLIVSSYTADGFMVQAKASISNPIFKKNTQLLVPLAASTAAVSSTSSPVVAANPLRRGLIIVNTGTTEPVSLSINGDSAVAGSGLTLMPNGGTWNMDEYSFTVESVEAITASGTSNLSIQEFN